MEFINTLDHLYRHLFADWAGWFLFFSSYLIIFLNRESNNNKKVLFAFLFVVTFHHMIAVVNAYIKTTFGASIDAMILHHAAINIADHQLAAKFGSGTHFYELILAQFYRIFGHSLFLGEELSIFAFLLSCYLLIKIYRMLNFSKHLPFIILLYGSLPSMLLFGSVTLRESWQILMFMTTMYFCFRNLFANSLTSWFLTFMSAVILSLLHEGLVIYVFLLAGLMVIYHTKAFLQNSNSDRTAHLYSIFLTLFAVSAALLVIIINTDKTPELAAFHALSQGKAWSFIADYHTRVIELKPRTIYGDSLSAHTMLGLIQTISAGFINYMFAPFPWQISQGMDIYGLLESLLRLTLIILGLIAWYKASPNNKKLITFFLFNYLLISFLWSLGTFSYGTSTRHHIVGYWILVLILGGWFHRHDLVKPHTKMITNTT